MICCARNINQPEEMNRNEISENILIADLIAAFPSTVSFLSEHNLHCIICGEPVWGTLKELAIDKDFSPKQIEGLVEELKMKVNQSDKN